MSKTVSMFLSLVWICDKKMSNNLNDLGYVVGRCEGQKKNIKYIAARFACRMIFLIF